MIDEVITGNSLTSYKSADSDFDELELDDDSNDE
jgi:hypothetical protein